MLRALCLAKQVVRHAYVRSQHVRRKNLKLNVISKRSFCIVRYHAYYRYSRQSHPQSRPTLLQRLQRKHFAVSSSSNNPQRNTTFAKLTDADISHFQSIIDNSGNNAILLSKNNEDISFYNRDWLGKYEGRSSCVLKPKTTNEMSAILSYCNERRLAVCVQSGNTGLVGGSVPLFDEIVISMSRMNNILTFDENSGILEVEAGVILQDCDKYLREDCKIPHLFPLDLGAKGSCQIGGNISTNAGGLRLVRFGSLHGSVLGLEVVLSDGRILNLMSKNRKDNTGYDLKQLFIGSEGTLGIITKASVLCPKLCQNTNVMFLSLNSFNNVLNVLKIAKTDLNEILSAIEFTDGASLRYPIEYLNYQSPFNDINIMDNPFYMVIETMGSNGDHDANKIELFIEKLFDSDLILDGTFAESAEQQEKLWAVREGIAPGMAESGRALFLYDISLPLDKMYEIVEIVQERFKKELGGEDSEEYKKIDITGFGHLGDGNLHLNVIAPHFDEKYVKILEPFIYEYCQSVGGSISAEHGIGLMKQNYLQYSKSDDAIQCMKGIKQLFDPYGILNPYKVLT